MIQRGKKSTAKLSVVALIPGQRAAPPRNLSAAEAVVWRATVATKPAEWFQPDSWPMLAEYCRAVAMCDVLAESIDALVLDGVGPATFGMLDGLLKMRDRQAKALNTFARAMRLTQQSRIKAQTANTAHDKATGAGAGALKPWQTNG